MKTCHHYCATNTITVLILIKKKIKKDDDDDDDSSTVYSGVRLTTLRKVPGACKPPEPSKRANMDFAVAGDVFGRFLLSDGFV